MTFIHVLIESNEQRVAVIRKALGDGQFVVMSAAGLFVIGDKKTAMCLFHEIAQEYGRQQGVSAMMVFEATDHGAKTPCISFGKPVQAALYGMNKGDYVEIARREYSDSTAPLQ
jgi:hypothetical protein